eukprot:CAMPEP_0183334600 /NCGR_PEP_ID=MMETSP0164_2-20130417/3167_1 /TAXON_ID=221442 /ORGANISM="Coccolithus pelagicus ssp braarudi, Strain PLY182g" /LENGTH=532 /DNA_ID=CAMNT_0025503779 /DNA_START=48 /DNA_END=1643 /DNA_ORIENTATION=+
MPPGSWRGTDAHLGPGHAAYQHRTLVLLNAQWRGGSTIAEQLLFTTTNATSFVLDEPAAKLFRQKNATATATALFEALRCDFHQYNHTSLVKWQHWRGEFTEQKESLHHASFDAMRRKCRSTRVQLRAIKTIRANGGLGRIANECLNQGSRGRHADFSCVLIELVRHPMATARSELSSHRLDLQTRSARLLRNPRQAREANLTKQKDVEAQRDRLALAKGASLDSLCEAMLKDIKAVYGHQRRLERLSLRKPVDSWERQLQQLRTVVLRYDEIVADPAAVARRMHALMQVRTDEDRLSKFVLDHFGAEELSEKQLAVGHKAKVSQRKVAEHLDPADRLRTLHAFATRRKWRKCSELDAMAEWPTCAQLVDTLTPFFSADVVRTQPRRTLPPLLPLLACLGCRVPSLPRHTILDASRRSPCRRCLGSVPALSIPAAAHHSGRPLPPPAGSVPDVPPLHLPCRVNARVGPEPGKCCQHCMLVYGIYSKQDLNVATCGIYIKGGYEAQQLILHYGQGTRRPSRRRQDCASIRAVR